MIIRSVASLFTCLFFVTGFLIDYTPVYDIPEQPNIIFILADDLGYGDLGVYGQQKIETPNIDALAHSGMAFSQHYSGSPVCASARYNLLTGKHPGNSYIRSNGNRPEPEWFDISDYTDVYEAVFALPEIEGQNSMPASSITVADVLKQAGYQTAAIGKWGNGGPGSEGHPNLQGFDYFYGYLDQRIAHTYYPSHMWENEERILLDNELVNPHQDLPEHLDPYDPGSYSLYHDQPDYSPDLMHEKAISFINEHHEKPFFLYLPTPIPHVSLQAPQRWIDYYRDKFGDEEPYTGVDGNYVPVRYPNATYAAMISYMDEQVGEIIEKLKELDLYDNTVIIFSSDNGPVDGHGVDPEYFNSAAPFNSSGGWTKGYVHEGGIRIPMIAAWPGVIPAGSTTDHISAFWDVLPTLSDIAGGVTPNEIDGISFLPVLLGNDDEQPQHEYLYWEFTGYGGQQAVRMGPWKAIRKNIKREDNLDIELYNLAIDMREHNNVSAHYPEIVEQMEDIMANEHTEPELEVFRMPALGDRE